MSQTVRELLARYLDDRDALSEVEFDRLLAELRQSPKLTAELRDQLVLDDLLAQKLAVDRIDFQSQVSQRVNDYEKQVAETFDHVAELRAIAEAELVHPSDKATSNGVVWWISLAAAASMLLAVGLVAGMWNWGGRQTVASLRTVEGEVQIDRNGQLTPAAENQPLLAGDVVRTAGGTAEWKYADGTLVRLEPNAIARLSDHSGHRGKRVQLDRGSLWANIAKQNPGRPMTFLTPHAEAVVKGTELRLVIQQESTELEVTHGAVEFVRTGDKQAVLVSTNEMCATGDRGHNLELHVVHWPTRRDDAVLLFKRADEETLMRNPADYGKWLVTDFERMGDPKSAGYIFGDRALFLNGGSFRSVEAGDDLLALMKAHDQLSLEAVFAVTHKQPNVNASLLDFRPDGQKPNWSLKQNGGEWLLRITTDKPEHQPAELKFQSPLEPQSLVHLTMTYRPGEWKAFVNGVKTAERNDVHGNFNTWQPGPVSVGNNSANQAPWQGAVFALAVYRRVLDEQEVSRNFQRAKAIYGRSAETPLPEQTP